MTVRAAGIALVTPDRRALFLRRGEGGDYAGFWCFPGGKLENDETPAQAAVREAHEEAGVRRAIDLDDEMLGEPFAVTPIGDGGEFANFAHRVNDEFQPSPLSDESTDAVWASVDQPPQPLHPGVALALKKLVEGMDTGSISYDSAISEEPMNDRPDRFAFDKASARTTDRDGRLHVTATPISKANVCPYRGAEIPDFEHLGLEPDRIYKLLRDPEELAKGAASFNNLPLLSEHVPVNADKPRPDLVVGSTGTDAEFDGTYLRNSLVVWVSNAIRDIESERKKELSSAYRYRADMTPGEFEGEKYDGVMRDIVGNHVALVKDGRAGSDVVVADSKEGLLMAGKTNKVRLSHMGAVAQGAILAFLGPRLAMDAKINVAPLLADVTTRNFNDKREEIVARVTKAIEGKLAQDADAEGLATLLEALSGSAGVEDLPLEEKKEDEAPPPPAAAKPDPTSDEEEDPPGGGEASGGDPIAAIKAFLAAKLTPEDMKEFEGMLAGLGQDEDDEEDEDNREKDEKDMVTKPAMDSAIKEAVSAAVAGERKRQADLRAAERKVRPWVGDLAIAFDSAEALKRHTLKMLGVKGHDTMHADALDAVLEAQPKPGARRVSASPAPAPKMAQDGKDGDASGFSKRFGAAEHISVN